MFPLAAAFKIISGTVNTIQGFRAALKVDENSELFRIDGSIRAVQELM